MNPNDIYRHQILQYFYGRNSVATSHHGKKGSAVKISDAKRELKQRFGLNQQQVISNLTYLIDQGWIKTFEVEKTVRVRGGTVPSTVVWYEITAAGIDKIEGESEFQPREKYAGINITATGENVITLGDGNVVNVQYKQLHQELDALKNAIATAPELNEKEKLDLAVDIETIKEQLAKATPNKTIVSHLWSGIEKAAVTSGLIDFVTKLKSLIAGLLC